MFSKILGFSLLTLAAAQSLPFNITAPSPDVWLVDSSFNTISWTPCSGPVAIQHQQFNVVVRNPNPALLIGNLTVAGPVPTTDCEKSYTPSNLPAGPNYQMFFFDSTTAELVAVGESFEIKPQGSAYATPSTTSSGPSPTDGSSSQSGGSGSTNSTGSGSAPNKKNGAVSSSSMLMEKTMLALLAVAGAAAFL